MNVIKSLDILEKKHDLYYSNRQSCSIIIASILEWKWAWSGKMDDTYIELLVKREKSKMAAVVSGILAVIGVLFFFLVVVTGNVFVFLIAVGFLAAAYLIPYNANVEYEYLYLNKDFSVDKIKNQTGRKTVASYDMSMLEVLAPVGSKHLDAFQNRSITKRMDFSSNFPDSNPYEMIVKEDGKLHLLIIEVNDALLSQIERIAPRKVFKD